MYKFVLVAALVSCVAAAPGYLVGGYGVPAATSYSSRVDYPSPVVTKTVVAAPIVPAYGLGYGGQYGGHYDGLVYPYGSGLYYGNNLGYGHGLGHGYGYGSLY